MSSEVLKKFGRYFLLDLIAQGGMAEIYRARLATKDGAGRLVVVKRIQAGFGGNHEFLNMFKSEIKVTMGFNHPNIVQVYDFGDEQNQPFITMELVDGKNLRQLLNRFKELGQAFPVELAAAVIEQAACGLHYAHTYKDKITGTSLEIVHRDISPQNIIISYEGSVKIIDFGIAKATTNSEHTRAGVIKGKPSYLAPEQISGDALDGRTDLFALGAVFWELLCGRKLFAGENDLAVLKLIESCTTSVRPPSQVNPNVPKEIDTIVMKLLSKQPEKRYQTGDELARALRRFLHAFAPEFAPSDLSTVTKELFHREIVEDRKKIQRLNERVEQLMQNDIPDIVNPGGKDERPEETTTFVARPPTALPQPKVEFKVDEKQDVPVLQVERPPMPPRAPTARPGYGIKEVGTGRPTATNYPRSPAVATGTMSRVSGKTARPQYEDSGSNFGLKGAVAAAVVLLVSGWAGPRFFGTDVPIISKLIYRGPASVTSPVPVPVPVPTVDAQTAPVQGEPEPVGAPAKLRLKIFPEGNDAKISVNGKFVDPSDPVIDVKTDSPLELLVQRPGFEDARSEFKIDSRSLEANGEYVKEIALEPKRGQVEGTIPAGADVGYLTLRSTPGAHTQIYVNGVFFKTQYAPFELLKLPVGRISVRLYNGTLDLEDQVSVDIEKNKTKQVQSNLKPRKR
jgi:serine/threonine-protein kinase